MRRRHLKRLRPMSQINVVPYIDVMLVLLIIFMVTAPLLTLGVNVELPQANAEAMDEAGEEPLVVSVTRDGEFYLSVGENPDQPLSSDELLERIITVLRQQPQTPVMVQGDRNVSYGRVMEAMVLIQQGGAPNVGLITDPAEG